MQTEFISLKSLPSNGKSKGNSYCTLHPNVEATENIINFVSYFSSSSNYISFKSHIQDSSSPYFASSRNTIFNYTIRNAKTCIDLKNQTLKGKKLNILNVLLEKRLIASLILLFIMVIVSMSLASMKGMLEIKEIVESFYNKTIEWTKDHHVSSIIQPLFCGFAVAVVGYALVYLDSDVPGVNPPSIYSPKKKIQYYQQKSSVHLGYLTAMAAGIVIAALNYLDI